MEEKKREFKAVAMRFTQEEFDGMDKSGMEIYNIWDFNRNPYLVNNHGHRNLITNFGDKEKNNHGRTVIETCDPKLFRQFCGLENSIEDELEAKMIPFELNPVFTPLTINLLKYAEEQKKIHDESKDSTSNNKREFRAIAMKCTQEDFDKMDRTGLGFIHIGNFLHQNYLVNNYHEKQRLVSNVMHVGDCSVLEFWDEDIFRICCGLEPKSKKDNSEFLLASFGSKKVEIGKLNFVEALDLLNGHAKIQPSDKMEKMIVESNPLIIPSLVLERTSRFSDRKEPSLNIVLKDKNVFSRIISEKDFSTPYFKDLLSQLRGKEMSDEMKHATNLEAAVRIYINEPIEGDNEPKTFKAKDIQFKSHDGTWVDCGSNSTLRFKPKPTPEESLSAEIESLSEKAKELGLKATVLFEES